MRQPLERLGEIPSGKFRGIPTVQPQEARLAALKGLVDRPVAQLLATATG